jgi:hypothetical protein
MAYNRNRRQQSLSVRTKISSLLALPGEHGFLSAKSDGLGERAMAFIVYLEPLCGDVFSRLFDAPGFFGNGFRREKR